MKHTLFTCAKWMRLKRRMSAHMECTLVGALEMLFHFGNANGDTLNACDVEAVCGWTQGNEGELLAALTDTGDGQYTNFLDVIGDGKVRIHDFWEHAPDCVKSRKRVQEYRDRKKQEHVRNSNADVTQCNVTVTDGNVTLRNCNVKPKPNQTKPTNTNVFNTFDQFWNEYPRKVNKPGALKSWKNKKLNDSIDIVLAGLEVWKASREWAKDNGQYIPHPATWLNQERWNDSPVIAKTEEQKNIDADIEGLGF